MPCPKLLPLRSKAIIISVVVSVLVGLFVFLLTILGVGLYLEFTPKDSTTTTGNVAGFTRKQLELLENIRLVAAAAGGLEASSEVDKILNQTTNNDDVCFDVGCLESALEIISAVNLSANPCEPEGWLDFVYKCRTKHSNQWHQLCVDAAENTMVLLEEETTDANEFLLDEAKTYYKQCRNKDTQNFENIRGIMSYALESEGGWPLFTNEAPPANFSWLDVVADQLRFEIEGFKPLLFNLDYAGGAVNFSTNGTLINLGFGRLSFSEFSYTELHDVIGRMTEMGKLGEHHSPDLDQLKAAYEFLEQLSANITQLIVSETGELGNFPVEDLTVTQLQQRTEEYFESKGIPFLAVETNWNQFFERVFADTGFSTPVFALPVLPILRIVEAVELEMRKEPQGRQNVVNALQLNLALMLLGETTSMLEQQSSCVSKTTGIFGFSLGKTYLNRYYDGSLIEPRVRSLMKEIRQGFLELLESPPWMMANNVNMTASTKEFLQDKINDIKINLAQPDWLREEGSSSSLAKFYEGLVVSQNVSYVTNFLNANKWKFVGKWSSIVRLLEAAWEKREFSAFDVTWNRYLGSCDAAYAVFANDILFLAGVLQEPMFDLSRPEFMNYAGLGAIIGHEIGHSITGRGRRFDKFGDNSTEHWDTTSLGMYEQWANDTAEFYDRVPYQISNNLTVQMNNALNTTINEDLADVLGLRAAFAAYQKYLEELEKDGKTEKVLPGLTAFTAEQLFFVKFAIMWCEKPDPDVTDYSGLVHSRPNRRADLPLRLSGEFESVFNCN